VARYIALLRGVNLGPRNRIAMAELRHVLENAGFEDVGTYLQSGNVVLTSRRSTDRVARECERQIAAHFGLDIAVVVRTRNELARAVDRNPLREVAVDPKRHQVTFLAGPLSRDAARSLEDAVGPEERFAVSGREVYAWHPRGAARSHLWSLLASPRLGVVATSRNWATVTKLLALADG
jgi:uncharacterized protein (DUF1697 family)